ncbi:exosome complex component RRP4 homolog isoform X2 [Durio zibethinus]|uniref:Exosome complex component RRP4 homolog isoform X2 n=1 Tax=Durio zibethinus TaxID=66656 RepID=A0A6P6BCP6_DURZI|nr:exosome complex component RRP4 homolog isoform X2 [Durio zibethinus]
MRGLQLPLSQTQRIRLQRAFEKLQSLSSKANSDASVTVADTIPVNYEDTFLKGHGTMDLNGELVATVCGVVERVNKLVYVRALRARYKPEVGDIVIGRVVEVAQKRWRLEINFSQDAVLMLSSMNMPDGIQAEVRNFQHDGSLQLQARNQKYGKLEKGQLLIIDPYLVKKSKQHFHHLEQFGVDLILGRNGFIWIGEHVEARDSMVVDQANSSEQSPVLEESNQAYTPLEMRQTICRIANAVRVLSTLGFNVDADLIMETVELSTSLTIDIHDMLGSEFHVLVAEMEAERRSLTTKRKR